MESPGTGIPHQMEVSGNRPGHDSGSARSCDPAAPPSSASTRNAPPNGSAASQSPAATSGEPRSVVPLGRSAWRTAPAAHQCAMAVAAPTGAGRSAVVLTGCRAATVAVSPSATPPTRCAQVRAAFAATPRKGTRSSASTSISMSASVRGTPVARPARSVPGWNPGGKSPVPVRGPLLSRQNAPST